MPEEKDVKQLFYDLYNNVRNEKADDKEFEILYRTNHNIARIHYDIISIYISNLTDKIMQKLANKIQDFVVKEIFK